MIIQAISDQLGIDEDQTEDSWAVLRKFGNMSSATLVFVLDNMRKRQLREDRTWVPALAFGPGLNVEGALLRRV